MEFYDVQITTDLRETIVIQVYASSLQLLLDAGSVSHEEAMDKAVTEYRKWQANTLSPVEEAYL